MNLVYAKVTLIGLFAQNVLAITHDKKISRPETFGTIPGQSPVDMKTYDTSLVRVVTPAPLSTLVEVLRLHSDKEFKEFSADHTNALKCKGVTFGDPYEKRAKNHYKVLIQDYMPMNEADAAAARYLFSVKACALRVDPKATPTSLTPCQYSGAKILSDIVKRLRHVHSLMMIGSVEPVPDAKVSVEIQQPKELTDQIKRIVNLLGTDEISGYLQAADPPVAIVWKNIRNSFA
jgi:hypothetical protein